MAGTRFSLRNFSPGYLVFSGWIFSALFVYPLLGGQAYAGKEKKHMNCRTLGIPTVRPDCGGNPETGCHLFRNGETGAPGVSRSERGEAGFREIHVGV